MKLLSNLYCFLICQDVLWFWLNVVLLSCNPNIPSQACKRTLDEDCLEIFTTITFLGIWDSMKNTGLLAILNSRLVAWQDSWKIMHECQVDYYRISLQSFTLVAILSGPHSCTHTLLSMSLGPWHVGHKLYILISEAFTRAFGALEEQWEMVHAQGISDGWWIVWF